MRKKKQKKTSKSSIWELRCILIISNLLSTQYLNWYKKVKKLNFGSFSVKKFLWFKWCNGVNGSSLSCSKFMMNRYLDVGNKQLTAWTYSSMWVDERAKSAQVVFGCHFSLSLKPRDGERAWVGTGGRYLSRGGANAHAETITEARR